jgi:hypothetical protein
MRIIGASAASLEAALLSSAQGLPAPQSLSVQLSCPSWQLQVLQASAAGMPVVPFL